MRSLVSTDPILGRVRFCRGCGETWPLDGEFWFFKHDGTALGRCKACWAERDSSGKFPRPLLPVPS